MITITSWAKVQVKDLLAYSYTKLVANAKSLVFDPEYEHALERHAAVQWNQWR